MAVRACTTGESAACLDSDGRAGVQLESIFCFRVEHPFLGRHAVLAKAFRAISQLTLHSKKGKPFTPFTIISCRKSFGP